MKNLVCGCELPHLREINGLLPLARAGKYGRKYWQIVRLQQRRQKLLQTVMVSLISDWSYRSH